VFFEHKYMIFVFFVFLFFNIPTEKVEL